MISNTQGVQSRCGKASWESWEMNGVLKNQNVAKKRKYISGGGQKLSIHFFKQIFIKNLLCVKQSP